MVQRLTGERDAARAESRRLSEENDQLRHLLRQFQRIAIWPPFRAARSRSDAAGAGDTETAVAERAAQLEKTAAPDLAADHQQKKQRHTNRGALPAHLPRIHITVAPEHTVCPCCRGPLHVI